VKPDLLAAEATSQLNALRGKALEEACRKLRLLDCQLIEKEKVVQELSLQVRFDRVLRESEHVAVKAECERLRQEIDQVRFLCVVVV
jgi:hypothetical protein